MQRWFWIPDGLVVIAFVVIGREDHGFASEVADYARVAAPFLLGLAVSGVALQAWRAPLRLPMGLGLAVGTVVIGMLARRFLWDDGTALSFMLVASGFIVAGMVGWRLVVLGVRRLVTARRTAAA